MVERGKEMLHVLFVSFPGQGHVNPLLRLAKLVAAKGLLVTFSSNASAGRKIHAATGGAAGDASPVGAGYLRFEFFDDGWDRDDSALDDEMHTLKTAGPPALSALIRRQADAGRPVSWVVNNPFVPWALDVAEELGIRSASLWVQSCAVFSVYRHFFHFPSMFPSSDDVSDWADFAIDLPAMPTLDLGDLPSFMLPSTPYKCLTTVIHDQFENLWKASYILVDSFDELERPILESTSKFSPPVKLLPVGPLFKSLTDTSASGPRGDMWKADDCLGWLDGHPPGSVLYVSFGSVVMLEPAQMVEVACGIQNSGRPFLWVVKAALRENLPVGFEEQVAAQGMVVAWSPQEAVLSHPAVGGFMTHCGWNSSMETLGCGVPIIGFPQWGDQVTNAKFMVDVFKVGVRLGSGEGGPLVPREDVTAAVEEVFSGPRSAEMKASALKWTAAAAAAVAAGGSSDRNIQGFVDEIRRESNLSSAPPVPLSGPPLHVAEATGIVAEQ